MEEDSRRILEEGAREIGAPLTGTQVGEFALYLGELVKWNKKLNLTSLKTETEIVIKHFLDSLTPLAHIGMGSFVMDLGSGAGLPGIPMKIARPDLRIILLEARGRRVAFLNNVIRALKLKNARAIQQRADSEGFRDVMGGHLDVVVARAFGETGEVLELGAPYLKPGGSMIVMKGPRWVEEKHPRSYQCGTDRLIRKQVAELELPALGDRRALLIYEKGK